MSKAKKKKRAKMQRLREAGWIVGTADEFVDSLSMTKEQTELLNKLMATRKIFYDNPCQETYNQTIADWCSITKPTGIVTEEFIDLIVKNKFAHRQIKDDAFKLAMIADELNLTFPEEYSNKVK